MSRDQMGPDPRLGVLLRIKEARMGVSRQKLTRALEVEEQRRQATGHAQDHFDHCTQVADTYVRDRFAAKGEITDAGGFFQSVALGSFGARRDASRALLVVERVAHRFTVSTREREEAARDFMAEMRTTEGLELFIERQTRASDLRHQIQEDDTAQETHAARGAFRGTYGKAR